MYDLEALVSAADDAALLAAVDGLAASRQWDELEDLAHRCRQAVELGRQLWGVAMHIDYRLAWEGPAEHAARTLAPGAGRFALGPLTEVAASTHDWAALAPHLQDPATAAIVAQERVLRGEDLTGRADRATAELPLALQPWEPAYALPRYSDRSARFPAPDPGQALHGPVTALPQAPAAREDSICRALAEVVRAWTAESTGTVAVAAVEGTAGDAIAAHTDEAVVADITAPEALALLQWAGASGGARGRRPGGAAGRFAAWWAAAAVAGVSWPEADDPDFAHALGESIDELRWRRWRRREPETGWVLRLAAADPAHGLAWAVEATDSADATSQDPVPATAV